jgi:alpha-glucan,water dikinase
MNKILYKCKQLVESLPFHESDQHHQYLRAQLVSFGIPASEFQQAWATIKRVWASKYNERAFLATKKLGVSINQIFMAVLVQRVVPSEYAYVIHTTNPTNSNDQEVYVESCLGLGEALVSDMPGQALSFSYDKVSKRTRVNNYPNKSLGLRAEGFIFRSDSNSEDLPGFAGAGLFDSYTMHKEDQFRISYNQERLIVNEQFRQQFMLKIGAIGHHIEQLYDDEPQDIEGAYYNGEYYVVQTRP